ncbi:Vacuolar protein sorting-associated protein 13 [Paramecium bursaria]
MAKEIEKFFVKRLQTTLLEYLNDFSQNNITKFSLGMSSNIRLENLSIKKQALLNFQLPMYIIDGKISAINLNMPLNYKYQQSEMTIDNIDLTVCAISESQFKREKKDGEDNLKKQKLKLWEEKMAKYFETLAPPNWISKIVDSIYDNMSIHVKSFSLTFTNASLLGPDSVLKIKFDMYIKATDSQFHQKFNQNPKFIYKLIEIKQFSIQLKGKQPTHSFRKEDFYVLHPMDITIKLTINKEADQLDKPIQDIQINIDSPIIFMMNKEQKNYLLKLNELLKNLEIIQDNFHLRPSMDIQQAKNYGEWWKYLINAVMQKQKNHRLDLGYSSRKLVLMKRYIQLYKRKQNIILVPWLQSWTLQDETKFNRCEKELSLKDLLKYRQWAFEEIRIEAKRYYHSSKDGQSSQSVKPLLEIWTNTINNQNSFKDQQKSPENDIPIELEDDEKINLYEILERDKTKVLSSYLKGQNNDPNQIKTKINLFIHSIFFLFIETRNTQHIQYIPKNTQIYKNCKCHNCYNVNLKKPPPVKQEYVKRSNKASSNNTQNINFFQQTIFDQQKQKQEQQMDDEYMTVRGMDSFASDFQDLELNKEILSQSIENEQAKQTNQQKNQQEATKLHKLFLIISLVGIKSGLNIFQNGRIISDNKGFVIEDIIISSPSMISTLIKNYKNKDSPNEQRADFYNEVFEICLTKEQIFLNSEGCFQNLIDFLIINDMLSIAEFLKLYEQEKNHYQDFDKQHFDTYDQFFDEKSPLYLHLNHEFIKEEAAQIVKQNTPQDKEVQKQQSSISQPQSGIGNLRNKLQQVASKVTKVSYLQSWKEQNFKNIVLQETHGKIVELIKKYLFIPFIEEYGDFILPLCIMNLKDKINQQQASDQFKFKVEIQLEGAKSEYRIQPSNNSKRQPNKAMSTIKASQTHSQTMNKSMFNKEVEVFESFVRVQIKKFPILLSTKTIFSLLSFMESQSQNVLNQNELFITENQLLLECILKTQFIQEPDDKQKLKLQLTIDDCLKIKVLSDQLPVIHKTQLTLSLSGLQAYTSEINELSQVESKIQSLLHANSNHTAQVLLIDNIQLTHQFYLNDRKEIYRKQSVGSLVDEQMQQLDETKKRLQEKEKVVIFDTQIKILIVESKLKNHALHTDSKVFIQIPYLEIQIRDSLVCLMELTHILQTKLKKQVLDDYKNKFIMSQDSLLKAELQTLYKDHENNETSFCKHCQLKFKKSIELTNILIGVIPQEAQQHINRGASKIWFQVLDSLAESRHNFGFSLQFYNMNRIRKDANTQTNIEIQTILITRDVGYFKDNITVHCSKSIKQNLKNEVKVRQSAEGLQRLPNHHNKFLIHSTYGKDQMKNTYFTSEILKSSSFKSEIQQLKQQMQDSVENPLDDQSNLFILFFYHKPLRTNLIIEMEGSPRIKDLKTHVFFSINQISCQFSNEIAAFTALNNIRNLQEINGIIQNIYQIIYEDRNVEKRRSMDLKQASQPNELYYPVQKLEEFIVSAQIRSFVFAYNQFNLKINEMSINLNLDDIRKNILYQTPQQPRKQVSLIQSNQVQSQRMRQSQVPMMDPQEKQRQLIQIMECQEIQLNFEEVTSINFAGIQLSKIQQQQTAQTIQFQVKRISIINTNKNISDKLRNNILVIPNNQSKQERILPAFQVQAEFFSYISLNIKIQPAIMQISQNRINELLGATSSIYQIDLREKIELRKYLEANIYNKQLQLKAQTKNDRHNNPPPSPETTEIYKMKKSSQKIEKQPFIKTILLKLDLQDLQIQLLENDKLFFSFNFEQIYVENRIFQDTLIQIKIKEIKPELSEKVSTYDNQIITSPLCIKIEGSLIHIDNMKLIVISKYMNDLMSFKQKLEDIIQQSKEKLSLDEQANQQFRFEECQRKMQDVAITTIKIKDSFIMVPERSNSLNFVQVYFQNCEIEVGNKTELNDIFYEIVKINLQDIRSQYYQSDDTQIRSKVYSQEQLHFVELFDAREITIEGQLPFYERDDIKKEFKEKDNINITLNDFTMNFDIQKLNTVQKYLETNSQEPSDVFAHQNKIIDRMNFTLRMTHLYLDVRRQVKNTIQKQGTKIEQKAQHRNSRFMSLDDQSSSSQARSVDSIRLKK